MNNFVPLVKSQIAWMQNQTSRFPVGHPRYRPAAISRYERLIKEHQDLLSFLESLPEAIAPDLEQPSGERRANIAPEVAQKPISDELANLPPEILKELSGLIVNGNSDPLVDIINERSGVATLDEVLIDAYRKLGEVNKRNLLANRLYRLSKRGLVWVSPGRKGIYSTRPPSVDQRDSVINLFNREMTLGS